jgi:hypothetical protein
MFNFCKHKWTVVLNERTTPPLTVLKNHGMTVSSGLPYMLEEKIVIVLSCDNCGKIYKTVTSNM